VRDEALEIQRGLIEAVVVHPGEKGPEIELRATVTTSPDRLSWRVVSSRAMIGTTTGPTMTASPRRLCRTFATLPDQTATRTCPLTHK
jgi:hypothetical protein